MGGSGSGSSRWPPQLGSHHARVGATDRTHVSEGTHAPRGCRLVRSGGGPLLRWSGARRDAQPVRPAPAALRARRPARRAGGRRAGPARPGTRLRFHEALRRRIPEAAAESRVRGARASAALDGADLPVELVRELMSGARAWPDELDPGVAHPQGGRRRDRRDGAGRRHSSAPPRCRRSPPARRRWRHPWSGPGAPARSGVRGSTTRPLTSSSTSGPRLPRRPCRAGWPRCPSSSSPPRQPRIGFRQQ